MSARRIRLLSVVLVAALCGAGVFVYWTLRTSSGTQAVRTVTAAIGTVTETVAASGAVEAGDTRAVSFATTGTIKDVLVRVGDRVEVGQPLARVDEATAQTQLRRARSTLAVAQAKLTQLHAGLTPAEREQLQLGVKQATMSVENARRSLSDATASAVIDGQSVSLSQDAAGRTASNARPTVRSMRLPRRRNSTRRKSRSTTSARLFGSTPGRRRPQSTPRSRICRTSGPTPTSPRSPTRQALTAQR